MILDKLYLKVWQHENVENSVQWDGTILFSRKTVYY